MKKVLFFLAPLLFLMAYSTFSQCTNASQFGTITAPTVPGVTTITTCAFGGEYSTINTCSAGSTYQFAASGGTGNYITIRQATPGGTVLGFGFSPITVVCTVSGPLYLHYNVDAACATDGSCHTGTINLIQPPCTTPGAQPTGLGLTAFSPSQINGSFTAATADGYLVVRYPAGSATTAPVNATAYTTGNTLGLGKVVSSSALTTFSATGLTPSTNYDFYVYAYNNLSCSGAPAYRLTSPTTASQATPACGGLAGGTYTVGPTGTYASLTAVTSALAGGTTGPTIFELQSTYLSTVETFPVTFTGGSCPIVGGITIRPQAGAAGLSITSANATGTLNFDGGSNITIDGRAGGAGPSQLTISNTALTGYTIHLINSASSNTFKYCTIAGVNTGATSGVIFFDNAVGLPTGNSNNTIDNCDIRDGATTPQNLIYASGNITDYASGNNNNTISNSLLHDWFNATSTTSSAAIRLFQGGSDWTITGNSFYQSATRTFTMTTATDQSAINITSALFGTNFTITNNFVGGSAPLCGGTAWTYTGVTTGTPTAKMISLTAAPVVTVNTISGNTLQNISVTTATTNNLSGLISHVSGNVNITNNTLGSQSATGNVTFTLTNTTAGVFYLPLAFGLGASPCIVNATNNNIGGITVANSSTGSCSFRVVYTQAVAGSQITVNNNLIGGTVANSLQQLSNNIFHGILVLNPTVGGIYTNNTIRNLTHNNVGVTGSVVGINVQASGGGHTITGNTVSNLTTNGTNVAINNAASVVGISMTGQAVGGTNISSNIISNLTNTNTTVAGWINGIYIATPASLPNTTISKNFVHSINLASTLNTAGMAGIFLPNTGFAQVYNNMVRLGIDASGASITNGLQINGIYKASSATMSIYHNSVYIGGTGVATGTANTYAFRRLTSGATTDTLMNNIFYNARSNASGTGKHYATFLNAATVLFSNYNDLFANGTGGVLGINVATDYTTLAAWRTATNQDWNSVSGDPQYVNPTGTSATVDLHISAAATPIEQAGYNLANVTTDYDAQARAGLTPVDLGADAGNFTVSDVAPPVIYLTPLINTCSTADRAVNGINITDATGVPLAGFVPRIYYKKNAGAWFSQPGTLASGTATNGIWNFNIVAADMGGLVATDVVSYYIIAQDIVGTPNIASNFGGAVATDVSTVTTQPTTPNTYTINGASLSGTYTVGAGGAYTTLTAAVAAYNSACLTGPVLFSLIDAAYAGETFPITINANPYSSSVNTLTIKPTLAATTISGTSATGLIVLNAADWVTINGSIAATVNTVCPAVAATRDLTLTNTNVSTASAVIWLQSTALFDAATNNKILNLNLVGSGGTQTFVGVGSGSTTISTASLGFGNINNSYINNNISKTQYGVFSQGSSLGFKNTGTIINQNLINTVAPNNTARGGIVTGFENGITISGNNISEIAHTSTPDVFGIAMGGIAISTSTFTGNEVTNATVTKNTIGSVRNTGTFSAAGIFVAPALSGTNLIANNMISGVSANGTSGDFSVGMLIGGGTGTTQVYYNTITMTSVPANTGATDKSYALAIAGFNPIADVRNNILVNTQNNGTANNYAVCYGYAPFTNLTSNNNDYYVAAGATFFIGATGSLSAPTNQLTVAALQATTAKDGAAQNVLPVFISATDLHLSTAANTNWCLNNKGVAVSVTDDIDCQVRNNPPDIGADEFVATSTGDIATPASQTICSATTITTIVLSGGATSYSWTRDNTVAATGIAASGTGNISGTLTNTTTAPVTVTFTITPLDANGCAGPATFTATVLVNPTPTAVATPSSQTVCSATPITTIVITGNAVAGVVYNWVRDNTVTVTGIAASGAGNISGTLTNTTTAPVTVTFTITPTANGCPGTPITATVLVNPTPTAVATPASQTICSATPITTIVITGNAVAGVVYNWTRDNTVAATGIAASGSGNISGTLTNTTTAPVTVTFTITPTANGCPGTPVTATVLVNPTPTAVATPASQTVCSGIAITTIAITGNAVAGVVYNWTRDNTVAATGIAASGAGNISGTLTNTTTAPVTVTFTITPTANGCAGTPVTATVLVNPTPTAVATPASQTVCSATPITTIAITGNAVAGVVYNWTRDNTVAVTGIAASGAGNISGTLTNTTASPVTVTFTIIPTANGCAGTPITATVLVNPLPIIGSTQVEPTTCASTDGSITLTLSGAAGPYTFAWTGPGVNPTSQNQTGLTVGSYNVTVTVTATGCTATSSFALAGPGGCSICPTVPTLTTSPSGAACAGSNVTFTASGLTNMGGTYGIIFKYSVAALANPYVGGTTIATVANGALTSGGTVATANSALIPAGTYNIYAILTPTPVDPACRPAAQTVLTIGTVPDVNQPANQVVCNNTATAAVNFSGSVPGTVFNWTNNTTSIGLAASGTGNIASFTATNATNAPVVATVTVTPSFTTSTPVTTTFNFTGGLQTFTVPAGVTSVDIQAFGAQGGSGATGGAAVAGGSGGLGASATGTLAVVPGQVLNIFVGGQGATPAGGFNGGGNGGNANSGGGGGASDVRAGGSGVANRVITAGGGGGGGRGGCDEAGATTGGVGGNGGIGGGGVGTDGANSPTTGGVAGGGFGGNAGSVQGAFGAKGIGCAGFSGLDGIATAIEIGGNGGGGQTCCCFTSGSIPGGGGGGGGQIGGGGAGGGSAGTTGCSGNSKGAGGGGGGGSSYTGGVTAGTTTPGVQSGNGQVTITYLAASVTCSGTPKTFIITVNPTPNAIATPASQTICSGATITTIALTSAVSGTTYNWTRDNSVTVTGIAASGAGNISGALTNTTSAPITVTFTITPTANSCAGAPITATVLVNPTPNAVATPASQTICSAATITTIVLSGNVAGTVYNWTRNNAVTVIGIAASGAGNIAGALTNTTNAPVTVTFTITPTANGCAGAPITATVLVNPTPNAVATPVSQAVCSAFPITTIVMTGNVSGTAYNWTRDNTVTVTGMAASGSGNISGSLINVTAAPITVTFTITPTANGCPGAPITATVTVTPQPAATISYAGNPYCSTDLTAPVTRTGTAGGTYSAAPAGLTINAATGTVTPNTSTPGTYTVTYTVAPAGGCLVYTTTTSITINAAPNMIIFYAGTPYCSNAGTANVTRFGTAGGTYSAAPAGLTINAATGAVTLGTSTPGTYTVTYSVTVAGCGITNTQTTITITAAPNATIAYAGSPYCSNAGTATVTLTGTAGGTYSSTPGLTLNAATGAVTLGSSTPGTYTVTYTVAASGGCATYTTTATITITALPAATIAYTGSPYCSNAGTATVTRTGTAGGTYTAAPAGLSINAATGDVNLAASTAGTYTVTYTVAAGGGCPAVATTASITITALPAATITYVGNPFCADAGTANVTRTGTAGGTYSAAPAGLTINAATGAVTLGTSTPGTYTVTYTIAAGGGCGVVTATTSITVNSLSVAPTAASASATTLCGPGTVTLSVVGGSLGSGATWKWYSASCGGTAVGTGATLNVTVNTTTTYFVRAEGTCNTTTCASVTVTVNTQPTISITASGTTLQPGQTITLTAAVTPAAGNTIIWYRDGVVVPGASGLTLAIGPDGVVGTYTARATTGAGCTALSNALTINATPSDKVWIYPNPNGGRFQVRYYTNAIQLGFNRVLKIYNQLGQVVYQHAFVISGAYGRMDVNLSLAPSGIYTIKVLDAFTNVQLAIGRVVIAH